MPVAEVPTTVRVCTLEAAEAVVEADADAEETEALATGSVVVIVAV